MEFKEKLVIVNFFAVTVALAGKEKVMLLSIIVVIEIIELACGVLS